MTVIDLTAAFTGDDLLAACAELGVRRPLGLTESMARHPAARPRRAIGAPRTLAVSDGTATALAVLAAPEAIAVVDRSARARQRVTYVAVRGPWGAVHRIHGDHHIVERFDAEDALFELLTAAGLERDEARTSATGAPIDITSAAFERMVELVAADDLPRAAAALEGDGAEATVSTAISAAARVATTHVLGLRSLGLRYDGCELAWIGDGPRWLAPRPARSADTGTVTGWLATARHVRVQLAPVDSTWLVAELSLLFA